MRVLLSAHTRRDKAHGLRNCTGRWSLLHVDSNTDSHKQVQANAKLLLERYGVVFRDLIAREKNLPPWRDLLRAFRQLEDRGEIRGGHFVRGFVGEQFALPHAIESLRAIRKESDNESLSLSAVDPLNLAGIILPGGRLPAISGKKVRMQNGEQAKEVPPF
jgi:ATP-dependent Lhr-like helicase